MRVQTCAGCSEVLPCCTVVIERRDGQELTGTNPNGSTYSVPQEVAPFCDACLEVLATPDGVSFGAQAEPEIRIASVLTNDLPHLRTIHPFFAAL